MSQDVQGITEEALQRPALDAIPDGSGNDRDPDESDADRFDAG